MVDKISQAKELVSLGFSVFPCHTIENGVCSCGDVNCSSVAKHPLTEHGVSDASNDLAKVESFFSGDYSIANIGIACGRVSGVWVLDVDDANALSALENVHGPIPKTWTVETGSGGRHLYFRYDQRSESFKNAVKFAGALDIRCDGSYALAPPSVHKSGNRYRWIDPPTECEIAIAPDWLCNLIPKRESVSAASTSVVDSSAFAQRSVANDETPTSTSVIRAKSLADRMRLYLAKSPVAISGDRGHDVTYSVVARCVELFGLLSDDDFLSALETWNVRCSPPWKQSALRHKLSDCRKQIVPQSPSYYPSAIVADVDLGDGDSDGEIEWPIPDPSAFHGLLGEIVNAIEPETESDPMGVMLSLLVACGSAIGGGPFVSVGAGRHGCNLFAAIVGDTASGKGESWSIARYVVGDSLGDNVSFGLSSGEGLVERVSDPIAENGEIVFDGEKRLLCIESEFAKPIAAMRREGNTLSPLLRSAWDRSTLEVMTRGKSKLKASNAFVSILAHVTPDELRKLFSDSVETSNGFSNRFLWCCVRSMKSLPNGGRVDVLNPYRSKLAAAIAKAKTMGELRRSPEAETLWASVYDSLKASRPGSYGKAVERGRPLVVRLSLMFAVIEGSPIITYDHLAAALAVWRYCDDSARFIFADESVTKLESKIVTIVKNRPGILRSELRKLFPHDAKTTTVFNASLESLLSRGRVVIVPVYGNRQADTVYPGVSITTTDLGRSEPMATSLSPKSATSTSTTTTTTTTTTESLSPKSVTLTEVVDWKNTNGIRFVRVDGGRIWVTPDCQRFVTPEIERWLTDNQETLAMFVPVSESKAESESEAIDVDAFFLELKAIAAANRYASM